MNIEKEVRFRVDKNNIKKIISISQPYKEKVSTLDITFGYNGFDSLSKYGFICRIRQKPNKSTLEVKKKIDGGWLEQEIKLEQLSDGINYFNLVGMKPYMYLQRDREVRRYGDLKIFIDEIDVVGDFVEIEYQDTSDSENMVKNFLKEAGLNGSSPQMLYGDIIKESLASDKEFEKKYNEGLNRVIDKYLNSQYKNILLYY